MTPTRTRLASLTGTAEGLLCLTGGAYAPGWWHLLLIPGAVWMVVGLTLLFSTSGWDALEENRQTRLERRSVYLAFLPYAALDVLS